MSDYYCPDTGKRLGSVGEVSLKLADPERYFADKREHELQIEQLDAMPITAKNVDDLLEGDVVLFRGQKRMVSMNSTDPFWSGVWFQYSSTYLAR
ncbi:MAG: hypothetical protein ACU0AU_13930 [Cognatishimia activa]